MTQYLFVGIFAAALGLILFLTSRNHVIDLEADWSSYRVWLAITGKTSSVFPKPSIIRTIAVYSWYGTGFLLTAFGGSIIGSLLIGLL